MPTRIAQTSELIPEELAKKSWIYCAYKSKKDLIRPTRGNVVMFTDTQFNTLVEEICSNVVCTAFEDVEYESDPMHPSDKKYSNVTKKEYMLMKIRFRQLQNMSRVKGVLLVTCVVQRQHYSH